VYTTHEVPSACIMSGRGKASVKANWRNTDTSGAEPAPDSKTLADEGSSRVLSCAESTQANFENFAQLLAPAKYACPLGKNISLFQPDVEVLAMTLKDMPLSSEQFGVMSNGREWVSMSFCVLNVGPPGFSNVPYTNGKKKGEKETNPLMLYDIVDGNTCFHSFEKGKTNKDKGPACRSSRRPCRSTTWTLKSCATRQQCSRVG